MNRYDQNLKDRIPLPPLPDVRKLKGESEENFLERLARRDLMERYARDAIVTDRAVRMVSDCPVCQGVAYQSWRCTACESVFTDAAQLDAMIEHDRAHRPIRNIDAERWHKLGWVVDMGEFDHPRFAEVQQALRSGSPTYLDEAIDKCFRDYSKRRAARKEGKE